MAYTLIEHGRNIFEVQLKTNKKSDEVRFAFFSDVHWDSPKCDRNRLTRDLQEARRRGAIPCFWGDTLDLMQARYDPRGHKDGVRPEHSVDRYFQSVVKDCAKYLAQFCKQMILTGGNHESNILKRQEVDIIQMLAEELRALGVEVLVGDYSGWVQVTIMRTDGSAKQSEWIQWHHGKGGNAKRSKGVLMVDLNQKENPDAAVSVEGHIHQKWVVPVTVRRINHTSRKVTRKRTLHIQCGTYKKMDYTAGWEAEKGFFEPVLGGWFVTFRKGTSNQVASLRARVEDMDEELEYA